MSAPTSGPAVLLRGVSKSYPSGPSAQNLLRALFGRPPREAGTRALHNVELAVERGTGLGIVGRNGSGKSTLLSIMAGLQQPTSGSVQLQGRIASLLDLGAGIDPQFTGRENALMLGITAGATRRELRDRIDAIAEFSGLGNAFDQPVRSYSTGMILRLAFSAAVHTDPDILLIDEVLAVGDAFFQQRCLLRVRKLKSDGCTIVLVTHDAGAVTGFCDQAIWLEHGEIACSGDPAIVVREYLGARYENSAALDQDPLPPTEDAERTPGEGAAIEPAREIPNSDGRYGSGRVRIEGVALRDVRGNGVGLLRAHQPVRLVITLRCVEGVEHPLVGFTLRNRLGEMITSTNTSHQGRALAPLEAGEEISVEFAVDWPPLVSGAYSISPAISDGSLDAHVMLDWIDNAIVLELENASARYGWFELEGVAVRSASSRVPRPSPEAPGLAREKEAGR